MHDPKPQSVTGETKRMIGPLSSSLLILLCTLSTCLKTVSEHKFREQKYGYKEQSWRNMNLSSVPLGLDHRVRHLDFSNNAIEHLSVLNLRALKNLDLSYNHLKFLHKEAFQNLVQLHFLNLARNSLDKNVISNSKAFQTLHGLKHLDISYNNLDNNATALYLQDAFSLENLTFIGNSLTRLTPQLFANNKNLKIIDIENNDILEIEVGTFEPLRKLSKLNLARNNLVYICDFQLYQVIHLNLSRNSIEFFLTHEREKMYQLEVLDLSHNNLLYFPVVPKKNKLRCLHLQNNKVGTLEHDLSTSETKSLYQSITNEEFHKAEGTHFNDLSPNEGLKTVVYLDLSGNHFRSFPITNLYNISSLETLNLSENCLQNISHDLSKKDFQMGWLFNSTMPTRYIDLQQNGIEFIPQLFFSIFPKLETLILKKNLVKPCGDLAHFRMTNIKDDMICVSFRNIPSLKHLDLQENGIKIIQPRTFLKTQLVSLNLAANGNLMLLRESFDGLENTLESLNIAQNNMSSSNVSLQCMKVLKTLNVSHNEYQDLTAYKCCPQLRELDVRHNYLTSFNYFKNFPPYLHSIYISGNTFDCCDTSWLKILQDRNTSIPDLDITECLLRIAENGTLYPLKIQDIWCSGENKTSQNSLRLILLTVFIISVFTVVVVCVARVNWPVGSLIV